MGGNGVKGPVLPVLAVAWRTGKHAHGRKLRTGGDLDTFLQDVVKETIAIIESSTFEAYRPDGGEPEDGTLFVTERNQRIDTELIDELSHGDNLDFVDQPDLRKRHFACYALVIGSEESKRIFIRRQDPVKLAKKRLFTSLGAGPLNEIESAVLTFDEYIDVVIEADRIIILNPKGFESLFRDSEAVLEAAPKWVGELRGHVEFSDEGQEILLNSIRRNGIHRRKLLAILDSGYASTLTPKRIREQMKKHELDHEEWLIDDVLQVTESNVGSVLKLLNDDLYRGDFSDEHFAASGKRVFRT